MSTLLVLVPEITDHWECRQQAASVNELIHQVGCVPTNITDLFSVSYSLVQRLEPEDRVDCQNPWIEPRMGDNTNTESLSYGARRRGTTHKPTLVARLGVEALLP